MISGLGVKIPHVFWPKHQKVRQKRHCNKFNKDFKNGPHKKNIKKINMGKLSLLNVLGFTQGHKRADGPVGMGNMGLWTFMI